MPSMWPKTTIMAANPLSPSRPGKYVWEPRFSTVRLNHKGGSAKEEMGEGDSPQRHRAHREKQIDLLCEPLCLRGESRSPLPRRELEGDGELALIAPGCRCASSEGDEKGLACVGRAAL